MNRESRAKLLAGLASAIGIAAMVGAQVPRANDEPFALFEKLMPVFSHPRCVNCHGAVRPSADSSPGPTGIVHGGDPDRGEPCAECHDDRAVAAEWRLAPAQLSFVGKDAMQLCRLQSEEAKKPDYLLHVSEDALIQQSFVGHSGGARTLPPDKAPGNHEEFMRLTMEWFDAGASCNSWTGTIEHVEEFESHYSYLTPAVGRTETTVVQNAVRKMTIRRRNGRVTTDIAVEGSATSTTVMESLTQDGRPCKIVTVSTESLRGLTPPGSEAELRIAIEADGTYAMHFEGPDEVVETRSRTTYGGDCGTASDSGGDEEPIRHSYDGYRMTARCPPGLSPDADSSFDCDIFDPIDFPRLQGSTARTIRDHQDADSPKTWLSTSPVGVSRGDDGTSLPVEVTTTWRLELAEPAPSP